MSSMADATGAGGSITLCGTTYLLSQLKIEDLGRLQAFVKERMPNSWKVLRDALRELDPGPPPDKPVITGDKGVDAVTLAKYEREFSRWEYEYGEFDKNRRILLESAQRDAESGMNSDPSRGRGLLLSPEGMAFTLWLSIRHKHPNVTLESIKEGVLSSDIEEISVSVKRVTTLPSDMKEKAELKN